MEKIKLGGGTIESHFGESIDKTPELLARYDKGEGVILSEADIRLLGIRNFRDVSIIANNEWITSTLLAAKGETMKVILPYEIGSRELTESARFGLGLINPNEDLVNYEVNLDVDGRWEKLEGNGVYTLQRRDLVFNKSLTEAQAMKHGLLLTKLGHPDYVDSKFARSKDEVAEIIGKTFELRKSERGYDTMMAQYMPDVSDKGILKTWRVGNLNEGAISNARVWFVQDYGRFAFDSVGDTKIYSESVEVDKARAQLQSLEGMLQTGQIDKIRSALDERDRLRDNVLTTDQIYSAIGGYIGSANEGDVRKVIDKLTSQ